MNTGKKAKASIKMFLVSLIQKFGLKYYDRRAITVCIPPASSCLSFHSLHL